MEKMILGILLAVANRLTREHTCSHVRGQRALSPTCIRKESMTEYSCDGESITRTDCEILRGRLCWSGRGGEEVGG